MRQAVASAVLETIVVFIIYPVVLLLTKQRASRVRKGSDHFPFVVFHFSFGRRAGTTKRGAPNEKWKMSNDKWKMTRPPRSEEHTSELQSQSNLVCRLLLE